MNFHIYDLILFLFQWQGAAKMVTETGMNPIELRDHVCSPAGTTIAGVEMLEQGGINATIINAVKKSTERSRELSK